MAKVHLKEFFFGGQTFCCCLPVRFGVITMSLLGILFGGILSIIIWFEVANTTGLTSGEKATFVLAGLVETVLLAASMLGFIGAIVRKQSFIQTYAYILYVHFFINLGVASYLLYVITHFASTALNKACEQTIKDTGAQGQCSDFLKVARNVYLVIAAIVLFTELYGAFIVARYVNQIQGEKRTAKSSRIARMSAFKENEFRMHDRSSSAPAVKVDDFSNDFDPYSEVGNQHGPSSSSRGYTSVPHVEEDHDDGYGGGSWTHNQISEEEKTRLRRLDEEAGIHTDNNQMPNPFEARDVKHSGGPPRSNHDEPDALPEYTR